MLQCTALNSIQIEFNAYFFCALFVVNLFFSWIIVWSHWQLLHFFHSSSFLHADVVFNSMFSIVIFQFKFLMFLFSFFLNFILVKFHRNKSVFYHFAFSFTFFKWAAFVNILMSIDLIQWARNPLKQNWLTGFFII